MSDERHKEKPQYDPLEFLRQGQERFLSKIVNDPVAPSPNTRGKPTIVVLVLILLAAVAFCVYIIAGYSRNSHSRQAAEERAVSNMAVKYNALIEWNTELEKLDTIYLSDVQAALIGKADRPILVNVMPVDVANDNDKYTVKFKKLEADDPQILFILEADTAQAKRILEGRDKETDFAAIALISSVRRATNEDIGEEVEDTDTFIAKGHCLDLMPINY